MLLGLPPLGEHEALAVVAHAGVGCFDGGEHLLFEVGVHGHGDECHEGYRCACEEEQPLVVAPAVGEGAEQGDRGHGQNGYERDYGRAAAGFADGQVAHAFPRFTVYGEQHVFRAPCAVHEPHGQDARLRARRFHLRLACHHVVDAVDAGLVEHVVFHILLERSPGELLGAWAAGLGAFVGHFHEIARHVRGRERRHRR